MAYSDKTRGIYNEVLHGIKDAGLFKQDIFTLHNPLILKWNFLRAPQ
jgi:hypothetical protein